MNSITSTPQWSDNFKMWFHKPNFYAQSKLNPRFACSKVGANQKVEKRKGKKRKNENKIEEITVRYAHSSHRRTRTLTYSLSWCLICAHIRAYTLSQCIIHTVKVEQRQSRVNIVPLRPYSSISKCQHKAQKMRWTNFSHWKKTVNLQEKTENEQIERKKLNTTTRCNYILLPLRLIQCYRSIFVIVTKRSPFNAHEISEQRKSVAILRSLENSQ